MIYKLQELAINEKEPFENCKLGRKQYADILTKVICQSRGGVLAIDGGWGSGKTTFVKMWRQQLVNQNFRVLYFNVWENDFVADPMVGLVGQLQEMCQSEKSKAAYKEMLVSAGKVIAGIFPAVIKGVATQCLGSDAGEIVKAAASTMANSFEKVIEEYTNQCRSMVEFRKALERLVKANAAQDGQPLIFMIDELDRCNPSFAVKVLERVKHLFNVPNVVFVLAIDKKQLCHSICGYYGSEKLNAEEYLKRFIDVEYKLPTPDVKKFVTYLYDAYGFDEFFNSALRCKNFPQGQEQADFLRMACLLFEAKRFNLRQMEKMCAHIRLSLMTFDDDMYVLPELVLMLMYFRFTDYAFYERIVSQSLTAQELANVVEVNLPRTLFMGDSSVVQYTVCVVAKLVVAYNLIEKDVSRENLLETIVHNDEVIGSHVMPQERFRRAIEFYLKDEHWGRSPLKYLVQHIELLKSFR